MNNSTQLLSFSKDSIENLIFNIIKKRFLWFKQPPKTIGIISHFFSNHSMQGVMYECIIDFMNLHLLNDPLTHLMKSRQHTSSLFLCVCLGGKSLYQARSVLAQSDEYFFNKHYPRIIPMIHPKDFINFFTFLKLSDIVIDIEKICIFYESFSDFLYDLKNYNFDTIHQKNPIMGRKYLDYCNYLFEKKFESQISFELLIGIGYKK